MMGGKERSPTRPAAPPPQFDYESWQWYASAQATVGSGIAGWLQVSADGSLKS